MKNKKQCRHCNHPLVDTKVCGACKQSQSRLPEIIAILLAAIIVGIVVYIQLFHEPRGTEKHPSSAHSTEQTPRELESEAEPFAYIRTSEPATKPTSKTTSLFSQSKPSQRSPNQRLSPPAPKRTTTYEGTPFKQSHETFPFYTAEKKWNSKSRQYEFWRKGMHGSEILLTTDARRHLLSENQADYPEPASGCGPTALLNLYIWYSKFGLLQESIRHADLETYKQLKFQQIDQKLLGVQRASRTEFGGTNTLAAIVAMDELVQEYSRNGARLHFEVKNPPLTTKDFLKFSRDFRAGILSVRPKDKTTGRLLGNHSVLCVRSDTNGVISIANWGEFSHGRLIQRKDGQWFIPQDPSQHELRINQLTTLIPFQPKERE